jgi:hypothetical protein
MGSLYAIDGDGIPTEYNNINPVGAASAAMSNNAPFAAEAAPTDNLYSRIIPEQLL